MGEGGRERNKIERRERVGRAGVYERESAREGRQSEGGPRERIHFL